MKKLWIVGQHLGVEENDWEFGGVFDSEQKAIEACRDDNYFIGPTSLNEPHPHETAEWEGSYYPLLEVTAK